MTSQEKMDNWFRGIRGFNIRAASDDKIIKNYKICCDSGYFLQAVKLRKEIHTRQLETNDILNIKLSDVPEEYYTTHSPEQISKDLMEYLNIYISKLGDSIKDSNLYIGRDKDCEIYYYGWDDIFDADLIIDVSKNIAKFTGCSEIDYTKNLDETLRLIKEELFYDY